MCSEAPARTGDSHIICPAGASLPVHGGMGGWWSSIPGKALVSAGLGVLARFVTSGLVDEVLAEAARAEAAGEAAESGERPCRRRVRVMPPRLTALFVLGLCLFSA